MPLIRTSLAYGFTTAITDKDPRIEVYEDVLYVPFNQNGWEPGIYDRGRKLIIASADFRAMPQAGPVFGKYVGNVDPDSVLDVIEEPLIFGCHFIPHYGHFLLSTLSRYWATAQIRTRGERILHLHPAPVDVFFAKSYVKDTLGQLDLAPADFLSFDRPVRIAKLTIPAPSFEENNIAYTAFSTLCHGIGDKIVGTSQPPRRSNPVYLSKTKVTSGIGTIINEGLFEMTLERAGVEIVYPENLTLKEQILVFRSAPVISGVIGSGMHTSIFSLGQSLVILNHEPSVMSNQLLIDNINGNNAVYMFPQGEIKNVGASEDFHVNYRLNNPVQLAVEFLRNLDSTLNAKAC